MLGLVYQSRALFAHYLLPVKDLLFQEPCGALEQENCLILLAPLQLRFMGLKFIM